MRDSLASSRPFGGPASLSVLFFPLLCSPLVGGKLTYLAREADGGAATSLRHLAERCREATGRGGLAVLGDDPRFGDAERFYEGLFEMARLPVVKFASHEKLDRVEAGGCVLIVLRTSEHLAELLDNWRRYTWRPENVYLLHRLQREPEVAPARLRRSLASMWRDGYLHRVMISGPDDEYVFHDPFSATIDHLRRGSLRAVDEVASVLRPRDTYNGYRLKVTLFDYLTMAKIDANTYDGADGKTMREICRMMNVTPIYRESKDLFGWSVNGTFTGTLGDVVHRRADVAFNGFFLKDYETKDAIEFSRYVTADSVCVVVPEKPQLPAYLVIARVFQPEAWVLIVVARLVIRLVYGLVRSSRGDPREIASRCFPVTQLLRYLEPPRAPGSRFGERFVLACSLMLGLVLGGCFCSQLTSSFSKPHYLKNIDSLEELDDSGTPILTNFPDFLDDVFFDNGEPTILSHLNAKLKLVSKAELRRRTLTTRDAGAIVRYNRFLLGSLDGKSLHVIKQHPKSYLLAFVVPRGSPFLKRVNAITSRIVSGGFYGKWLDDMRPKPKPGNESKTRPMAIRISHLYIPFAILFAGLLASLIVFLREYGRSRSSSPGTRSSARASSPRLREQDSTVRRIVRGLSTGCESRRGETRMIPSEIPAYRPLNCI